MSGLTLKWHIGYQERNAIRMKSQLLQRPRQLISRGENLPTNGDGQGPDHVHLLVAPLTHRRPLDRDHHYRNATTASILDRSRPSIATSLLCLEAGSKLKTKAGEPTSTPLAGRLLGHGLHNQLNNLHLLQSSHRN